MSQAIGNAQTGIKLDAVEGTWTQPTSADFIHDGVYETMSLQISKEDLRNVGRNGITARVNGQEIATIPNATIPSFGHQDIPLLLAAGFTSAAANTYILYAPNSTGANASRTSIRTISIAQYDGKYRYQTSGAKPTNMSLGVVDQRKIAWTAGFQGAGSVSATSTMIMQTPITSASVAVMKNAPLSILGIAAPYSDITLDLGLTYEQGTGDASTSTGHRLIGEITSYDPKMTVTVWSEDSVLALYNSYVNATVAAVSWTYGTGTGNVRTWTFNGMFDSIATGKDGNLINMTYVISPIAKTDGELIRLTIA